MHRLGPQALGREQLEHLAGAHHISGADLGDDFGGDDAHDPVEALLRAALAGHDAAQAAEEAADRGDMLGGAPLGCARGVPDLAHPPAPWPSAEPVRAEVNR